MSSPSSPETPSPGARARAAAAALRDRLPLAAEARVGLVLGSGLGAFAEGLEDAASLPFSAIPGFPEARVVGHAGRVVAGRCRGVPVLVLQGRVHLYEGWSATDVVTPVRALIGAGVDRLLVTNAAGGIHAEMRSGDLMRIADHLNLTGHNPLVGPEDPALGPRFPDMSFAYDPELGEAVERVAAGRGLPLRRGVYAGLLGPSYETPAEIRMLRTLGADAVGMSTVLEVIAARHMGARVAGLSCITNAAAGSIPGAVLSHDEVTAAALGVTASLVDLLAGVVDEWSGAAAGIGTARP